MEFEKIILEHWKQTDCYKCDSVNDRRKKVKLKVKVKQSRYRPGVAQRVPGS
jgi:hypothetical protein